MKFGKDFLEKTEELSNILGSMSEQEAEMYILSCVITMLGNNRSDILNFSSEFGEIRILGDEASKFFDKVLEAKKNHEMQENENDIRNR